MARWPFGRGAAPRDGDAASFVAADPIAPLIDAFDDPVLIVAAGQVTHANAAARALLGSHIVAEDVRVALRHPAAAGVLAEREAGPVLLPGLGGQERQWELSARAIDGDRRLLRLTDRSGTRAAERMRVDFVANASHELRTPLATLIGFIETLEDANGPADAAVRLRFLGIMAGEARRMQRLIDDLMSLSRIEADRYTRPRDTVDLAKILTEACRELEPDSGGRLAVTLSRAPVRLPGDHAQLSQLVHNIAGNALKYAGSASPVRVLLTIEGDSARLDVADEGDGIAPEHLPRLTERFYRADPGRSRAIGGTGLGLAIVKHIVERHRGRLDIASVVGRGTTVTIRLPLGYDPLP